MASCITGNSFRKAEICLIKKYILFYLKKKTRRKRIWQNARQVIPSERKMGFWLIPLLSGNTFLSINTEQIHHPNGVSHK